MYSNMPGFDALKKSFDRVYRGPSELQQRLAIAREAEALKIPLETYRYLYERKDDEEIEPYPQTKNWGKLLPEWSNWLSQLPGKKKFSLARKGLVKLAQSGVVITVVGALGHYIWEAPARQQQAHYQAWQLINSAAVQTGSGGRIEALQALAKDGVSLQNVKVDQAFLEHIQLSGANLSWSIFSDADLVAAVLSHADLSNADFRRADLAGADLAGADLAGADLSHVTLTGADLTGADLTGAAFSETIALAVDFRQAKVLTKQQLEGKTPPLLCNVALPKGIQVNLNRDCDQMPQTLVDRQDFNSFDEAKKYVDALRQKKWE
jgi:hypothetical protein